MDTRQPLSIQPISKPAKMLFRRATQIKIESFERRYGLIDDITYKPEANTEVAD